MPHLLSVRTAARALCAAATFGLAACTTLKQVSIHDPELAAAALQAQSAFTSAGSGELWTTMIDNLERGSKVERELLASTMSMRFEGELQGVESTTWADLLTCAQGGCSEGLAVEVARLTDEDVLLPEFDLMRTSDKIAATAVAIAKIGDEIDELSKQMVADPSGAAETGMLSEAPTSFLADGIGLVERRIATLEEKLEAVKQEKLGRMEEAIDAVLPRLPPELGERAAQIRAALTARIGDLREALERASFASLATTAASESAAALAAAGIAADEGLQPALEHAIQGAFDEFFAPLDAHLEATDVVLAEAETLVAEALGEGSLPSERLAGIADVLRKAEHLDFLKPDTLAEVLEGAGDTPLSGDVAEALGVRTAKDLLELIEKRDARIEALADKVSIAQLLESLRGEQLSDEFKAALQKHTGTDIANIGGLLDYLKTDDASLQEVRVALMADWRRAVVEGRALQLESLRYRLALTNKLAEALKSQRLAEDALLANMQRVRSCLTDAPLSRRDPRSQQDIVLGQGVTITLQSLAQGAQLGPASPNEECEPLQGARRQFESLVGILGDYFQRVGFLQDNEHLAHYELVRYEHRRSIDASRLAAAAHEQLVKHGLQGLVAFTQGGITAEQVATVMRFLNVGLLNVIANED